MGGEREREGGREGERERERDVSYVHEIVHNFQKVSWWYIYVHVRIYMYMHMYMYIHVYLEKRVSPCHMFRLVVSTTSPVPQDLDE